MAIIPQGYSDAVVAIGTINNQGNKVWFATGFVVARKHELGGYNTFLITNKHVLDTGNKQIQYTRQNRFKRLCSNITWWWRKQKVFHSSGEWCSMSTSKWKYFKFRPRLLKCFPFRWYDINTRANDR